MKMMDIEAPASGDPQWVTWSEPLYEFLSKPRNWASLNAWCKEQQFGATKLRQCLAWLEDRGLVRSLGAERDIIWLRTRLESHSYEEAEFELTGT